MTSIKILFFTFIISVTALNCNNIEQNLNILEGKDTVITSDKNAEPKISIIKPHEEANYENILAIPLPEGFERIELDSNAFGTYLRKFPLKTENNIVFLHDGNKKWSQDIHFAVLKIDVGKRDLQQCADAVMRLRAEYLFENKKYSDIHFNFLSDGKPRYYTKYVGNDRTHKKFRSYMDYIFSYANTASLKRELKAVDINDIVPGDVFIQSGNPYGHAITVMDVAVNNNTGKKIFMISQSYMPAQDIHILKNLNDETLSPWYSLEFGEALNTPEWIFYKGDLKRFAE